MIREHGRRKPWVKRRYHERFRKLSESVHSDITPPLPNSLFIPTRVLRPVKNPQVVFVTGKFQIGLSHSLGKVAVLGLVDPAHFPGEGRRLATQHDSHRLVSKGSTLETARPVSSINDQLSLWTEVILPQQLLTGLDDEPAGRPMVDMTLVRVRCSHHGRMETGDDLLYKLNHRLARVRQVGLHYIFVGGVIAG